MQMPSRLADPAELLVGYAKVELPVRIPRRASGRAKQEGKVPRRAAARCLRSLAGISIVEDDDWRAHDAAARLCDSGSDLFVDGARIAQIGAPTEQPHDARINE